MSNLDVRVSPLSSLQRCQLHDAAGALAHMSCTYSDPQGIRCENPVEAHGDHHWVGEHTIVHALRGRDVACVAVTGALSR